METFHFRGLVHPQSVALTIDYQPHLMRKDADESSDSEIVARVADGAVVVEVTVEAFSADVANALFQPAYDVVRSLLDVASLESGISFALELHEVVDPAGKPKGLILSDRRLSALVGSTERFGVEAITDLLLTDVQVARAASDLVQMLAWPHYGPIACGRVVEALLRSVTGGKTPQHWSKFHEVLRVDRAYLEPLTEHSKPARHGDRVYVPGAVTSELATRAWCLFDRYIAYRLIECDALPLEDYPALCG